MITCRNRYLLNCAFLLCLSQFVVVPCVAIQSDSQSPSGYNFLLINEAQHDGIGTVLCSSSAHLLFSASDDGSVNVYRDGSQLIQHLQISTNPIARIAFDGDSRIAILEQKPDRRFRLSLWNWKNANELWFAEFGEQALSLSFSPRGTFVICTLARWNSLLFIDSDSGTVRPWLQQGFGIIDYTLVSSREERIMCYDGTSGILTYHDLLTGSEIKRLSTKRKLTQFQVVPDSTRTRACALDGKNVVIIDLITGTVLSSKDPGFSPLLLVSDDTTPGRIVAIGGPPNSARSQTYSIENTTGNLVALGTNEKLSLKNGLDSAGFLGGQLFVGDADGFLYQTLGNDRLQLVAERKLARVVGLGFADRSIYLSTSSGFIRINTELANLKSYSTTVNTPLTERLIPGINPRIGVLNIDEQYLLLWDRSSNPQLYRYSTVRDGVNAVSSTMSLSLLKVKNVNKQVLTVDIGGQVRILDAADFSPVFSRNVLGALGAEVLNSNELLIVKASSGRQDSPLLRIIRRTGETIPVPSSDDAVFLSKNNTFDGWLYTLSISRNNGLYSTCLKRMNPTSLSQAGETVLSFPGEDFQADLVASSDSPLVYTSAGRNLISTWDGKTSGTLERNTRFPRQLACWGKILAGINYDGSVSLWDTETRKLLMDIFVLNSGTCFFLTRDGFYGLMQPVNGYKTTADSLRDRADAENCLRPSLNDYDNGAFTIRSASYPLVLP